MYCPKCGTANDEQAAFCKQCGAALKTAGGVTSNRILNRGNYAGFWRRAAAYLIDLIIFAPLYSGGPLIFYYVEDYTVLEIALVSLFVCYLVGFWLYTSLMESSRKQATLGKMALHIRVTDLKGDRISFGRATGRYFGRWLSYYTFYIGFIMIAFTEKKQGLHDMMANTLVMNK